MKPFTAVSSFQIFVPEKTGWLKYTQSWSEQGTWLCNFYNDTLTREDLDAPAQWLAICEAEHLYYGGNEPFKGLPYQLCLETAPREQLLTLIRAKRTRGYESLMDRFGVLY